MGRRRDSAEIARDRRRCADLYLQGWLQVEIAEELRIDQSTVSRDLKALQQEWLASALIDFDAAKAQELAKIDRLEREYWQAWERSCEDAETVKQKGEPSTEPGKVKTDTVERTVKGQAGDPRFLAGVQWCIEQRCKILGIKAPVKVAPTDPSGQKPYDDSLTDEERIGRLVAIFEQARARRDVAASGATGGNEGDPDAPRLDT